MLDTGIVFDFFSNKKSSSKTENLLFESRTALSTITVFELFKGVTNVKHIEQRKFPLFTTNKKHFERISGLILY